MTDKALAKQWLRMVGADAIIPNKKRQEKIALSLLRAWRRYQETGLCPWSKDALYDYTYFLHAFAEHFSGSDDELYHWLSAQGIKMLDIIDGNREKSYCRVCSRPIASGHEGAGKILCNNCACNTLALKFGS